MEKQIIKNHFNNINKINIDDKMDEFITDEDLELYLGNINNKIIKYSDLDDYTFYKLLPHNKSFIIILSEDQPNKGHWVALLRYGRTIEYFDSYGQPPSYYIKKLSPEINNLVGNNGLYLNEILNQALVRNYKVIYNKMKLQKLDNDINTCGKHVLYRIICMKHYNYNLLDFQKNMTRLMKKFNMSSDEIVTMFIPKLDID